MFRHVMSAIVISTICPVREIRLVASWAPCSYDRRPWSWWASKAWP